MFSLTLVDHLRLTFSQISQRYQAHTKAATRRTYWNRVLRGSEALLMTAASVGSIAAAFGQHRVFVIAAAVFATLALLVLIVHLTFDFQTSASTHATSSASLWRVRERYRSLLSDLHEGVVSVAEARVRRDRLIEELGAILEHGEMLPVETSPDEGVGANGPEAGPASPVASVPT
jgi:hypothetical protein